MSLASLTVVARRAPPWTLALAGASAIVFSLLAALVALRLTASSDLGWTRAFQSIASDPVDLLANAHTVVGQLAVTLVLAALIAVVTWRRLGGWAWLGLVLILATGAVELLFKFVLQHPGPPQEFVRSSHNLLGIRLASPSSFPSGHLARLTFLALVVAALWPRTAVWMVAAAFVGLSVFLRVYIGDHWLSDALAGVVLGAAWGALAVAWMRATAQR